MTVVAWRSPEGELLGALVRRLSAVGRDVDLSLDERLTEIAAEFLSSGVFEEFDEDLFEILLSWAGLDVGSCDGLTRAVELYGFLVGTGVIRFACVHGDDPTPLCGRVRSGQADAAECHAEDSSGQRPLRRLIQLGHARADLAIDRERAV